MKPARFSYFFPRDAVEAVTMIEAAGEDARFLAGGQSLVPMMNFRIVQPSALIDLSACEDLSFIRHDNGKLRIGAMTRQRDAETNEDVLAHCPLLSQALSFAGPDTIKNRATVGGSIANGYPVAELPVVAVCLDAKMILVGGQGERTIAAADFFITGMVTAIKTGELLREIVFPARGERTCYAFAECGNHSGGAALAIVAARADRIAGGALEQVALAAAGLQPIPLRLRNLEAKLDEDGSSAALYEAYLHDMETIVEGGEVEPDSNQRDLVWALVEEAIVALKIGVNENVR